MRCHLRGIEPKIKSLFAAILLVGACASGAGQEARFPTAANPEFTNPVDIRSRLYRPAGAGPFPAVIVLHGCGGPDSHHRGWAEKLASWGYVALVPDSFGSRGRQNICEQAFDISASTRAADVVGAADYLAAQPYVAKDRIGVIGFSHGGWTIMRGTQTDAQWGAHGIKAAVAYYPYCDSATDRNVALPLLIVMGDKDDWVSAERCKRLQAAGFRQPELVEAVYYPNTYHAFDRQQPTAFVGGVGNDGVVRTRRLEFNARAARDAEARTRAFFDRLLR